MPGPDGCADPDPRTDPERDGRPRDGVPAGRRGARSAKEGGRPRAGGAVRTSHGRRSRQFVGRGCRGGTRRVRSPRDRRRIVAAPQDAVDEVTEVGRSLVTPFVFARIVRYRGHGSTRQLYTFWFNRFGLWSTTGGSRRRRGAWARPRRRRRRPRADERGPGRDRDGGGRTGRAGDRPRRPRPAADRTRAVRGSSRGRRHRGVRRGRSSRRAAPVGLSRPRRAPSAGRRRGTPRGVPRRSRPGTRGRARGRTREASLPPGP